jgi:hypothetical protein
MGFAPVQPARLPGARSNIPLLAKAFSTYKNCRAKSGNPCVVNIEPFNED